MESPLSAYVRILSYKHQKENLNGIKRSQDITFRSAGFDDWFVGLERKHAKTVIKKKAVGENAATRVHVRKSLAPGYGLLLDRNHVEMKEIMLPPSPPPRPK